MKYITLKLFYSVLGILIFASVAIGQFISSQFDIVTTYSPNEKFYLRIVS